MCTQALLALPEAEVYCSVFQSVVMCCGVLRCVAVCCGVLRCVGGGLCQTCLCWVGVPFVLELLRFVKLHHTATNYDALQHTATHCNMPQHTAPRGNLL